MDLAVRGAAQAIRLERGLCLERVHAELRSRLEQAAGRDEQVLSNIAPARPLPSGALSPSALATLARREKLWELHAQPQARLQEALERALEREMLSQRRGLQRATALDCAHAAPSWADALVRVVLKQCESLCKARCLVVEATLGSRAVEKSKNEEEQRLLSGAEEALTELIAALTDPDLESEGDKKRDKESVEQPRKTGTSPDPWPCPAAAVRRFLKLQRRMGDVLPENAASEGAATKSKTDAAAARPDPAPPRSLDQCPTCSLGRVADTVRLIEQTLAAQSQSTDLGESMATLNPSTSAPKPGTLQPNACTCDAEKAALKLRRGSPHLDSDPVKPPPPLHTQPMSDGWRDGPFRGEESRAIHDSASDARAAFPHLLQRHFNGRKRNL
ncbi:hypothetical protein H632_c2168p0 [Helicosporidium sp. ATCC 50920]|nr:hypothetical protein H632_c2168p0 [Helicosporidium sp. ATCC 50920]|eukprot:KDD73448.1 hypothetical protein H632_c2168p0 [Helicosporidium sp. ATCC 50920]